MLLPLAAYADGSYLKLGAGPSRYSVDGFSENKTGCPLAYGQALDKSWGIEGGYVSSARLSGLETSNGAAARALRTPWRFVRGQRTHAGRYFFATITRIGI